MFPSLEDTETRAPSAVESRRATKLPPLSGQTARDEDLARRLEEVYSAMQTMRAEREREKAAESQVHERNQEAVNAKLSTIGNALTSLNTQLTSLSARVQRLEDSSVFQRFDELAGSFYGLYSGLDAKFKESSERTEALYARLGKIEADAAEKSRGGSSAESLAKAHGLISQLQNRCDETDRTFRTALERQSSEANRNMELQAGLFRRALDDFHGGLEAKIGILSKRCDEADQSAPKTLCSGLQILNQAVSELHSKVDGLETKMKDVVQHTAECIKENASNIDSRLGTLDTAVDSMKKRIDALENERGPTKCTRTLALITSSSSRAISNPAVVSSEQGLLVTFREEMIRLMTCKWLGQIPENPVCTVEGYITDEIRLAYYFKTNLRSPFTGEHVDTRFMRSPMLDSLSALTLQYQDTTDQDALKVFYNKVREWFAPVIRSNVFSPVLHSNGRYSELELGFTAYYSRTIDKMLSLVKAYSKFAE